MPIIACANLSCVSYLDGQLRQLSRWPDAASYLDGLRDAVCGRCCCVCRRGGGYYGGRGFVFIDPTDIFLIWDPRYGRHQRERADSGEMTFVEAVFSFVFGDGNPNENFEVGTDTCAQCIAWTSLLALTMPLTMPASQHVTGPDSTPSMQHRLCKATYGSCFFRTTSQTNSCG